MSRGKMDRLETYIPVSERIRKFRDEYPEGIITTERSDPAEDIVAFKAKVYRNVEEAVALAPIGVATSTGHSELEVSDEKVVEKAETVAVGRALANLGYEIDNGIASAEEMDAVKEDKKETKSRRSRRSRDEDTEEEAEEKPRTRRSRKAEKEEEPEDNDDNQDEDEDKEEPRKSRRGRRSEKKEDKEEESEDNDSEEGSSRRRRKSSNSRSRRFG